jgi:hypothetical protein
MGTAQSSSSAAQPLAPPVGCTCQGATRPVLRADTRKGLAEGARRMARLRQPTSLPDSRPRETTTPLLLSTLAATLPAPASAREHPSMTPLESEVDQLRCGVARGHPASSLCRPTDRPSLPPESACRSRTGLLEFQIDDLQSDVQRWRVRHAEEVKRRQPLVREVKAYGPSPSACSGELLVLTPSRPTGL